MEEELLIAELHYEPHYSEVHDQLVQFIRQHYPDVQSGLQGDSWIWVFQGSMKVAVDTFSAMKHQVKCLPESVELAEQLIDCLSTRYQVNRLNGAE